MSDLQAGGSVTRLTMPEYLSLKAFSAGLAYRILAESPLHAWYDSPYNPDRHGDNGQAADIGTYAHALLLEGELPSLLPLDFPDFKTKAAREARDAAYAEGKTPILARKLQPVRTMVERARQYVESTPLAGLFANGEPELSITWTERGVECKARPDWLSKDRRIILSYKTTPGSAAPDSWIRRQLPLYAIGMPLYERGVRSVFGVERTRVVHLTQEQKPPYACSLIALDPAAQDVAERKLDRALSLWRECLETKRFPAYPLDICYAEARAWEMAEVEQAEIETLELET